MKYNIITYLIGEGFKNVLKNKKSTGSSIIIMCATMIVFGVFFIIGENINYFMSELEGAQGIRVFIKNDATEEEVTKVGEQINSIDGVNTVQYKSKEQALDEMKEQFGEKSYLLDPYEENNIFSESYVVTLTDLSLSSQVQDQIWQLENIKKITSSDQTISTLLKLAKAIRIGTGVILILLVAISIFIISNTIKLTVHARRKEISIMKYVGATNNFIRSPFIVEGILMGVISAIISIALIGSVYSTIANKIVNTEIMQTMGMSLVSFSNMFNLIVVIYLLLGIGIGILGSSISMRKYLKV